MTQVIVDSRAVEESFRWFVRSRREGMALSQAELARRMTEGGSPLIQSQIQKIESGARAVSLAEAVALTAILGGTGAVREEAIRLRGELINLAITATRIAAELHHAATLIVLADRSSSEG